MAITYGTQTEWVTTGVTTNTTRTLVWGDYGTTHTGPIPQYSSSTDEYYTITFGDSKKKKKPQPQEKDGQLLFW